VSTVVPTSYGFLARRVWRQGLYHSVQEKWLVYSREGPRVCRLAAGAKEIRTHGPTPNASVPREAQDRIMSVASAPAEKSA
jgi:hypothetical protein